MKLLCDNDIIHKLAAFDLQNESLAVLGVAWPDVYVLPTARFFFALKKPQKGEAKYGVEVFSRITQFVSAAHALEEHVDVADEEILAGAYGVHAGEAILFALASRSTDSLVATGDKQSLFALGQTPACRPILEKLRGRVVCLEQLLKLLIRVHGFEFVRDKILPGVSCDGSIHAAFGSGLLATEANVLDALDGFMRDIPVDLLHA